MFLKLLVGDKGLVHNDLADIRVSLDDSCKLKARNGKDLDILHRFQLISSLFIV